MKTYAFSPSDPVRRNITSREQGLIYLYDVEVKKFLFTSQLFVYEYPVAVRHGFSEDHAALGHPQEENEFLKEMLRRKRLRYSMRRSKAAIYDLAKSNEFDWFCTWTFDRIMVDRFDYDDCSRCLSYWLDQMRRQYPDFRYVIVSELHSGKTSDQDVFGNYAFHFHGLVGGVPDQELYFYRMNETRELFSFESFRWGINSASRIEDPVRAANYIGKYVTKDLTLDVRGQKKYWRSRNLKMPEVKRYGVFRPDEHPDIEKLQHDERFLYGKIVPHGTGRCLIAEMTGDQDLDEILGSLHVLPADPAWINGKYRAADIFDDM